MILANITFGSRRRNDKDHLENVASGYLSSLLRSGQICDQYFLTWTKGLLNAHVLLAGRGGWELRYHSKYGRNELDNVAEVFGGKPAWKMLDDESRLPPSSWKGAPFLYLFTHAFDRISPVCRGDGKAAVPLFLLPLSFEQKEQIYFWQQSYIHHDSIWLGSRALELPAYRQLADPNSELAEDGRDLCRELETATGVPTFYYLMRYWGRRKGEDERLCPGCGAGWKAARPAETSDLFHHFNFKCDRCRLVSHLGVSTDGGRHTRVGEFQERKRANRAARRALPSVP